MSLNKVLPERPHDPRKLALKKALRQASSFYSTKKIIDAARDYASKDWDYSEPALRTFLDNPNGTITWDKYKPLAAFWLHSPLGRALRFPKPEDAQPFDRLTDMLASGRETLPHSLKNVDGAYFVYHGSNLVPDHYVVRVLHITSDDDHILTVTDTVRNTHEDGRESVGHGAMIFAGGLPQILLHNTVNRFGFTLMIGGPPMRHDERGHLTWVIGSFLVLNSKHRIAYRRFLMQYVPEGDTTAMIAEAGVYSRDELHTPERQHHKDAFDRLWRHKPAEEFPAPIEGWKARAGVDNNGR